MSPGRGKGARDGNHRLNAVAYRAGRLNAAGEVDEFVAREALIQAAQAAGLPAFEPARTFSSGFRAGQRVPAARAAS